MMALPGKGVESQGSIPEIEIRKSGSWFDVLCNHDDCYDTMVDYADSEDGAEEIKAQHMKWHEEGMQE